MSAASNLCGVGAYCLGGCDPANSYSIQSCMPQPVCQPGTYTFSDFSSIYDISSVTKNTEYLGGTGTSWVSYGEIAAGVYDHSVQLIMPPGTVGALLASTFYVWYGRVTTTLVTATGRGVVTSFSLLSNTGDEIGHYIAGVNAAYTHSRYFSRSAITGGCKSQCLSLV